MSRHSDLDTRMKEFYEQIPKTKLMRRTPVIIRIDGKAFHTFTKGFKKPFDEVLIKSMQETTRYLCENIQGCVLGYTQSDEISLVLVDYQKLNSDAWFSYEVQKVCSIAASMATMAFNKFFRYNAECVIQNYATDFEMWGLYGKDTPEYKLCRVYERAIDKGALFDARCHNIPREEVTNYIYWRQLDASKNSIQAVGQANFTQKELHGKSCNDVQDMLKVEKGINWNDFPIYKKRGTCVVKQEYWVNDKGNEVENDNITDVDEPVEDAFARTRWIIDDVIPIFKGDDRDYVDKLIMVGE